MSRPSKLESTACWSLLLGISALACGVDDRALRPDTDTGTSGAGAHPSAGIDGRSPDGGEGSSRPQGGTAGTGSASNEGGQAGTPPPLPPLVGGCADLDTDGVADCSVTLVKNATFGTDTKEWIGVGVADLAWDARNALGDDPSGCALVSARGSTDVDGTATFVASQCVPVAGNHLVIAYANAWVEASGVDDPARALLQVSYFDADDCGGVATGYFVTPPSSVVGEWVTIQAGGVTGASTHSASVELIGVKPNRAESLSACFDNVMVKTKSL